MERRSCTFDIPGLERRSVPGVGLVRAQAAGGVHVVSGYGAVFYNPNDPGTEYQLMEDVFERILPGAFDRAIREKHDCRSFFNHNADIILGRTTAGSLKLSIDKRGLWYEASVANTSLIADQVLSPISRGEVTGSSFMFTPLESAWREAKVDGHVVYIRELVDLKLYEVGPVCFPAYESATTGARAADLAGVLDSLEAFRGGSGEAAAVAARCREVLAQEQQAADREAMAVRMRALKVGEEELGR